MLSNITTCHDYVDLSVCFEDTAILIGICVIFWMLAGLKFLVTSCSQAKTLPYSKLHACKQVSQILVGSRKICSWSGLFFEMCGIFYNRYSK